jgi:basic amino acid/polyamine antiporter, APA family
MRGIRSTTPVHGLASRWNMRLPPVPSEPPPQLRREIGLFSATLLVVGGIIGSGIFFTPAEVARGLPTGTAILVVWAVGGLVALAGALTYAELGAMMPDAGGPYVYIREAFGGLAAFLYGWMVLLIIGTGALAAVAMGFAGYVARFADVSPVGGPIGVAAITIASLTLLNYFGIRPGTAVQNLLTIAKVLALGAIIVAGLFAIGGPAPPPAAGAPAAPGFFQGAAAAFVAVLFTIGGWQQMNMVAGEIRRPATTIPRALMLGIAIVIACYIGANVAYLTALGRDGLAASTAVAADSATRLAGPRAGTLIVIAAMLSILGFVNVVILANPRIFFAMARDGVFFDRVARVHPRHGSPHVAILLMGGWAIALLLLTRGEVGALLSGVVFADWIFFGLGAASVFVLRRTHANVDRPYRALGYPVIPAFFVAAAAVGVISSFVSTPRTSLLGVLMLGAGAVAYRRFRRGLEREQ